MMTPQVHPGVNARNENVNALQTPMQTPSIAARAGGSKSAGYFTPRAVNATPMSSNAVSATPGRAVAGRRELGAGALHLWNLHETPNSVAAARTASASIMTADVRPCPLLYNRADRASHAPSVYADCMKKQS